MFEPGSFKWASVDARHGSSIVNEIILNKLKPVPNSSFSKGLLILLCCYTAIAPLGLAVYHDWQAQKNLDALRREGDNKFIRSESIRKDTLADQLIRNWPPSNSEIEFVALSMIMGSNFISLEEAEKCLGMKFSESDHKVLDEGIPYSGEVLEQCQDTHILVPMPALSIMEIRALIPVEIFWDQDWYTDQDFAKEKCRAGWRLIRKTIVPDSAGKNYDEQRAQLGDDEEVPPACELVYAVALYRLASNEELFSNIWARTSALSSHGDRVDVSFCFGRLDVSYWLDGLRSDNLALASSRKVSK